MKLEKKWEEYSSEVIQYLRNSLSNSEFLEKFSLYQLGFVTEEGDTENTPKTGKLLRPTLLLMTLDGLTGEKWHSGVPAAAAIEIFHNATLLVDDWQDGDYARRGRKALWTLPQVGPRQAVNIGLFLFTLSSRMFTSPDVDGFSNGVLTKAEQLFEETKMDVIRGQQMDIAFEERIAVGMSEYLLMVELKTARLIQTSLLLGALLGGASEEVYQNISLFGKQLGLLFQLQDDYLGIYGNETTMGKPADDIAHKKKSLPVMLVMEQAMNDEKKVLHDLYAKADFLHQEEVEIVKNIFEKLSIKEKTREMIELTYQNALEALDAIPDDFTKKEDLRTLADVFAHREK